MPNVDVDGVNHPVEDGHPPGYSSPLHNGHSDGSTNGLTNGQVNGMTNGHAKENGIHSRIREESTSSNSSEEHEHHMHEHHHRVGGGPLRPRSASLTNSQSLPGTVIRLPPSHTDYRKRQSIWSGSDKIPTQEPPATRDDPLYDPACDPEHPKVITFQDISAAQYRLRGGIQYTPCSKSHMSQMTGMDIYFKKDLFQYTGSFKERGARNFLLHMTKNERDIGVIATSAGNHALALSYHGVALGIPVTVVMPRNAPIMKVSLCKSYGATVILTGNNIAESKDFAMRMAKEKKLTYVNGYDHPYILAGQGTCGLEMLEQVPDMDAAIIPVGGGGLVAGMAVALKTLNPKITIIGVESERCPGFYQALKAGKPTYTSTSSTLADGLAVPVVGFNSFATAAPLIDKMVVVKEEFIALAILRLVEMEKVVVEGAGATGLAAVLSGQLPELVGKK
ncbi:hypothetical protein RvY_09654-2 [Ramazzottius varieornatus]|nr:hypothetical protein RvY_09654-2 [Ramazzottius varieornatus]